MAIGKDRFSSLLIRYHLSSMSLGQLIICIVLDQWEKLQECLVLRLFVMYRQFGHHHKTCPPYKLVPPYFFRHLPQGGNRDAQVKPCRRLVAARPPTSMLLSNTVTVFPASRNIGAAASPLHPASIMAIDFNVSLFPGGFIAPSSILKRKLIILSNINTGGQSSLHQICIRFIRHLAELF
jgi:hypothetical protein